MSKTTSRSVGLVIALGLAMVFTNGVVFAQDQQTEPQTTTTKKQVTPGKRSSTTKKKTEASSSTEATGDQVTMPQQEIPVMAASQTTTTTPTTQTDLSGSYVGTFKCDELGLTGDTTLTISGNEFTTADGKSGRVVASTTKGYTAVALQTGDGTTATPTVVSLRGRKSGNRLTLTPVSGSNGACSFVPASASARRRSIKQTPAASGAEVSSPADVGPAPTELSSPTAPRKNTKRTTNRSRTEIANPSTPSTAMPSMPDNPVPAQSPSPSPSPMPTPVPNPSPDASPSPTPTGSPTPIPNPSPEPSPSPSPSPSPRPKG